MVQEYEYLNLLNKVLDSGEVREDRTGVGTRSLFGSRMIFDINEEFPLLTTKFVSFKLIASELLWFLSGSTNINDLKAIYSKNTIWDEWADERGELGPVYGAQWRNFNNSGYDQIKQIVNQLKYSPNDRRIVMSAWNPQQLNEMALPPCHMFAQFYVRQGQFLDCQIYQRSCDIFLGVPFNIASYALLTYMLAKVSVYKPGQLIWVGGDTHLYSNHVEQAKLQLSRAPRQFPILDITDHESIDDFTMQDFDLMDYAPHAPIGAPIAV